MSLPNNNYEGLQSAGSSRNNLNQQEHSPHTLSELSSSTSPSPNTLPTQSQTKANTLPTQPSIPQNTYQNQTKNLLPQSSHPMITISKFGIFQSKVYTVTLINKEPSTVQEALSDQNWHQTMRDEYEALIKNETWSLVLFLNAYKVVDSKWVFRIKQNTNGSIAKYKVKLGGVCFFCLKSE